MINVGAGALDEQFDAALRTVGIGGARPAVRAAASNGLRDFA
jgi:hypothetical protein